MRIVAAVEEGAGHNRFLRGGRAMTANGRTARILLMTFLLGGLWSGESQLRAQANVTASIGGYVLDDSGNFIPGASVILLSPALNTRREMISSSEGRFLFAALPVGTYTLRVHI